MSVRTDDQEPDGNEKNKEENNVREAINLEEVQAYIAQQVKEQVASAPQQAAPSTDQAEMMKQLVEGLKEKSDSEKYGAQSGYVDVTDIDKDDFLGPGKEENFYAHKTGYVVVDDKRNGLPVQTPFKNVIVFKYQATRKLGTGKDVQLFSYANYVCKSRKEAQWLRDHSMYGTMFFSRADTALNVDGRKAIKLAKFMTNMANLDQYALFNMAKQHGVEPGTDVQELRARLANKFAEKAMDEEKAASSAVLMETRKAEELMGFSPPN